MPSAEWFAGQKLPGDEPTGHHLRHPVAWLPALNVRAVNYYCARTMIFADSLVAALMVDAVVYLCSSITRLPM